MLAGLKTAAAIWKHPGARERAYQISKKIVEGFQKKNGATVCKDLKGVETGHPLRSCDGCIEDAAELVEQILFSEE